MNHTPISSNEKRLQKTDSNLSAQESKRKRLQSSLFFCQPPPSYALSVHGGYKIQACLCIGRHPIIYEEPLFEKRWRIEREQWETRTNNFQDMSNEVTFMKMPSHFFQEERIEKNTDVLTTKKASFERSELEALLAKGFEPKDTHKARNRQKNQQKKESRITTKESSNETHSLQRQSRRMLYLVVKYGCSWQFPLEDRIHGQSMRQTLRRLCYRQLGENFVPFFVGYTPFAVERRRFVEPLPFIEGRQVFYYRAHYIPETQNVSINDPISDFAWVTSNELASYLHEKDLQIVRNGIMLDS